MTYRTEETLESGQITMVLYLAQKAVDAPNQAKFLSDVWGGLTHAEGTLLLAEISRIERIVAA